MKQEVTKFVKFGVMVSYIGWILGLCLLILGCGAFLVRDNFAIGTVIYCAILTVFYLGTTFAVYKTMIKPNQYLVNYAEILNEPLFEKKK